MMKAKSGISFIVLIITIAVLAIIASTVIYISADATNNAKLVAFASDLEQMEDLVTEYYLTNNELPIITATTYTTTTLVSSIEDGASDLSNEITANGDDDATFYKIDMSKLDISSTSRGIEQDGDLTDIFVIAENSLNIYYLKGQKVANKYYFSLTEELTGKVKLNNSNETDASTITISGSTETVILKKSTAEWTNVLTVEVTSNLLSGESLKYYIAGEDVTDSVVDNVIEVSSIVGADADVNAKFYSSDSNKKVTVEKYSNDVVIATESINVSNLDVLTGTTVTSEDISYTQYNDFKLVKITGYSDLGGSGLKEIRVLYTSKLDSEGNTVAYYDSLPAEITKEYVYSKGVKNSATTFKIPSDVIEYSLVFIDNAGNISEIVNATTVKEEADTTNPSAKITLSATTTDTNTSITARVVQTDNESGINISECRWEYVYENSAEIGTNSSYYTGTFTSADQTLTLSNHLTPGTYYLHVLTVDNEGNTIETISDPITVNAVVEEPTRGYYLLEDHSAATYYFCPHVNTYISWNMPTIVSLEYLEIDYIQYYPDSYGQISTPCGNFDVSAGQLTVYGTTGTYTLKFFWSDNTYDQDEINIESYCSCTV